MANRLGFNQGAVEVDVLRGERLEFRLAVRGAAANFSVADELDTEVVSDRHFPGVHDVIAWRLTFTAEGTNVRITAEKPDGTPASPYSRLVSTHLADTTLAPAFAIGLVFATAVGYELRMECVRSNGVRTRVMDLQFTGGVPGDHNEEPFSVDFA